MSKKDEKFELSVVKMAKDINYEKPNYPNNLVDESEYIKIDNTLSNAVALTNAGTTLVREEVLPDLLAENKKDTRYIVDNKIPDSQKLTINSERYIKSGAVLSETHTRSEEHPDAAKRAKNSYVSQSLVNISKSAETKAQKGDYEDFAKKEEKKLGKTRKRKNNINNDEITGDPLKGNGDFHHANKKTLYPDPVQRLDPDKGIVVNSETHIDIHKNNINDEKELANYIEEQRKMK